MEQEEGLGPAKPDLQQREPRAPASRGASARDLGKRLLEVESNSVLVATIVLIGFIGALHPDFLAWGAAEGGHRPSSPATP
jgi:hypothetical protein